MIQTAHDERLRVAFEFAVAFMPISGVLAVLGALGAGILFGADAALLGGLIVLSACALVIANALMAGQRDAAQFLKDQVADWLDEQEAHRQARYGQPARPAPPPAPLIVTTGVAEPEKIGGIDAADVTYFDREIDHVGWTERQWVGRSLPNGYSISKGENGGYVRLLQLYVDKGLIVKRGGPGNATGELTEKSHAERMRILRNLAARPAPPA